MRFVLGILVVLQAMCIADLLGCNIIGSKSPELRLKRQLFCEYDLGVMPVNSKNTTINVMVDLIPVLMDFNERTGMITLHSFIFLQWKDEHLTWKPDDFEGVSKLHVRSDEIWVPDISFYTTGEFSGFLNGAGIPQTTCQLSNSGEVTCVPALKMSTPCETSYTYWPYDNQTCDFSLGSWSHTSDVIDFSYRDTPIIMEHYEENKEWRITHYTVEKDPPSDCCPNRTFLSLHTIFYLERHSPILHSAYITPIIVLMSITLTVLWLDSRSIERIYLGGLNFICHLLCIYSLHWLLPFNGSTPPHILLFYRDSMVLATFAMIVTSLLRRLQSTEISAPSWIVATVTLVANNQAGRFLLAGGEKLDDVDNNGEENSEVVLTEAKGKLQPDFWRKLAIIVEWLAFFVGLFTYVVMIFLLVPSSGYQTKAMSYNATGQNGF